MPWKKEETHHQHGSTIATNQNIANARGRKRIRRNALRSAILQLSEAGEDASVNGHDVLPRDRRADGNIVPRVRTRFGIRTAKYAREDEPVQLNEVV
jgi:hypothetical protein